MDCDGTKDGYDLEITLAVSRAVGIPVVASGGAADPVMLAGGIGTALTTTFWGLVVAIPALAGYALLRNRIDELTIEATLQAEEFVAPFRPAGSTAEKAT